MNYEEAQAWLRGERSWANMVPQDPFETWTLRIAEADAEAAKQAYWVVRAHREGLVHPAIDEEGSKVERPEGVSRAESLRESIRTAINRASAESGSNTPDFILAEYVMASLRAFDAAVVDRDRWYGRQNPFDNVIAKDPPAGEDPTNA